MDDLLRWYDLIIGSLALISMVFQHRGVWRSLPDADFRLRYGALVFYMFAGVSGNVEGLIFGIPGGWRLTILAVAATWTLASVIYRPFSIRHDRQPKE